jgi:LemA protein
MMSTLLWVLVGLVATILFVVLYLYRTFKGTQNLLVALDQRCDTAFADIDVHLKHRHNLIPGLIGVVKGAAGHEKDIVLGVVDARAKALGAMSAEVKLAAEGNLSANISTLLASFDKFPEIRALPEFVQLRQQLVDCENRITAARRFYNLAIEEYNTALRQFPGSWLAQKMRLNSRQVYDLGIERVLIDEPVAVAF